MPIDVDGDVSQIDRKNVKLMIGDDVMDDMIAWLDEKHPATDVVAASGKEVKCKQQVWLWAHNGKKFDNYVLLHALKNYKFKSIVKSASGIIKLEVRGKNTRVFFMCTLAHLGVSLAKLCEEYEVPN